jgi:hypothetical protein
MGWRNIAFSCLNNAEARLKEAREALQKRGPLEPFVRALLQTQEACNMALGEALDDGVRALTAEREVEEGKKT